ncbi:MAG: DUF3267 domain-containing protein [Clostridia bacterium]|nr:DUF3267 domain-containing protein [Clostridia bacterium]
MKNKNFEKILPQKYVQIKHIDATNVKLGIILNVVAGVVIGAFIAAAMFILGVTDKLPLDFKPLPLLLGALGTFAYIALHELTHGAAYKLTTGEKLTYGLKWSCAFCGVPHIFVYRKAAIFALAAPLTLFTVLLAPLSIWLYFVNPFAFLVSAFVLGSHLGGCCGDIYMLCLLLFKYRQKELLVKDTGPEQFLYLPESES